MRAHPFDLGVLVGIMVLASLVACSKKEEPPTASAITSTPSLWTDSATGCQYLQHWTVYAVTLTPRLGLDGKPMCGTVIEKEKVRKDT